jgi:hypothetical protein
MRCRQHGPPLDLALEQRPGIATLPRREGKTD